MLGTWTEMGMQDKEWDWWERQNRERRKRKERGERKAGGKENESPG